VQAACASEAPFDHLVLNHVFPDDVYNAMLTAMPLAADYRPMSGRSKGHDLADGTHTRVKIDLFPEYVRGLPPEKRAVWDVVGRALCTNAVKRAFVQRLAPVLRRRFGAGFGEVGMYPVPVLTRDIPGYQIPPHPDTRWVDHCPALLAARRQHVAYRHHLSRTAARRQPARAADEAPNTGYAFAVGDDTRIPPIRPTGRNLGLDPAHLFRRSGLPRFLRNRQADGQFLGNDSLSRKGAGARLGTKASPLKPS
jgi:hypothetical protein